MTEQLAQTASSHPTLDSSTSMNTWELAKKRANAYLKLHRLPETEREQLLTRITSKLARAGLFGEQELIQLFISTAQAEVALLQAQAKADSSPQKAAQPTHSVTDEQDGKADNRTQTGPRFERSSIRVAPLQAITLLPSSRPRQRLITK
ncbi:MAG: hypothetical protein RL122_1556 [Pseudomonadota bacterium]|jgi:cell division septum initiation protein DivIVA|uniref:Uncharacterized protein n=1 Tax=Thiothrix fructosivorans TaxID=111770 RepID=A0A8B0SG91_9GAMM|nr:hypothetical protein [Thiothrix fructosivorans]MBO0614278.1 hypothetical protein [Thiothrix fructosivorans]QTX09128.1 hypothetical protein J1836_010735 [Thiothrix fructosivorans]